MSDNLGSVVVERYQPAPGVDRWRIQKVTDKTYWTGYSWSKDAKHAKVYNKDNEAGHDSFMLIVDAHKDKQVRFFMAPVVVKLLCDEGVDLEALKKWLYQAASLYINTPACGDGPVPQSVAVAMIGWDQIREMDEKGEQALLSVP